MKVEIESSADVCTLFADAVKEGKYRKMDYGLWRKWATNKSKVTLKFDGDSVTISNGYSCDTFKRNDRGFGDFLYDMYYKEEGTETMLSANNIVIKPGDYLNLDDCLVLDEKTASSVEYDEIATIANVSTKADKSELATLEARVDELENIYKEKIGYNKEKKEMKNFNFDFGKVMDSQARVSMYGIAVKSPSGTWVAYDKKTEQMMDVDILNFEGMDMLYKMPVAINQVAAGDVIIHMGKPCFVVSFNEEGKTFNVIDIFNAEEKSILPVRSPFGFNFVTKLVSLIDFTGSASADQPFGNMLPFLMMKDGNMDDMLPFLMMSQGGDFTSNPMMMMLLMDKGGDKSEMFKMMAMAQMFNQKK